MKELLQLHALSHVCNYKDAFIHALTDGASGPSLISPSSTHTNLDECVSVASVCSHKHTHTHTRWRYLRWWRHVWIPQRSGSARMETSRKTPPLRNRKQKHVQCTVPTVCIYLRTTFKGLLSVHENVSQPPEPKTQTCSSSNDQRRQQWVPMDSHVNSPV